MMKSEVSTIWCRVELTIVLDSNLTEYIEMRSIYTTKRIRDYLQHMLAVREGDERSIDRLVGTALALQ